MLGAGRSESSSITLGPAVPISEPQGEWDCSHDRWFLDRIATHILAFEGDSHVEWFEGNCEDYVKDHRKRVGVDADTPHRIKYGKVDAR
jgi:hypothetical protein